MLDTYGRSRDATATGVGRVTTGLSPSDDEWVADALSAVVQSGGGLSQAPSHANKLNRLFDALQIEGSTYALRATRLLLLLNKVLSEHQDEQGGDAPRGMLILLGLLPDYRLSRTNDRRKNAIPYLLPEAPSGYQLASFARRQEPKVRMDIAILLREYVSAEQDTASGSDRRIESQLLDDALVAYRMAHNRAARVILLGDSVDRQRQACWRLLFDFCGVLVAVRSSTDDGLGIAKRAALLTQARFDVVRWIPTDSLSRNELFDIWERSRSLHGFNRELDTSAWGKQLVEDWQQQFIGQDGIANLIEMRGSMGMLESLRNTDERDFPERAAARERDHFVQAAVEELLDNYHSMHPDRFIDEMDWEYPDPEQTLNWIVLAKHRRFI